MPLASRTTLYTISIAFHAMLGAFLARIPPPTHRETVAISFIETKKPKPPAPAALPPEPDPVPSPAPPLKAKAAPPKTQAPPPSAHARAASGLDALPDFGLSLGGEATGGLAVPSGAAPETAPREVGAKSLAQPHATAPRHEECAEPPVKPKPLSRPTPAYTAEARAAGVSGKVRVEIVVDERGHVVSARVLEGLGHGLDEAALSAAREMTFEAGVRCGKPVTATFKIGFTFAPSAT